MGDVCPGSGASGEAAAGQLLYPGSLAMPPRGHGDGRGWLMEVTLGVSSLGPWETSGWLEPGSGEVWAGPGPPAGPRRPIENDPFHISYRNVNS